MIWRQIGKCTLELKYEGMMREHLLLLLTQHQRAPLKNETCC